MYCFVCTREKTSAAPAVSSVQATIRGARRKRPARILLVSGSLTGPGRSVFVATDCPARDHLLVLPQKSTHLPGLGPRECS